MLMTKDSGAYRSGSELRSCSRKVLELEFGVVPYMTGLLVGFSGRYSTSTGIMLEKG
jgi:hypothetical protein